MRGVSKYVWVSIVVGLGILLYQVADRLNSAETAGLPKDLPLALKLVAISLPIGSVAGLVTVICFSHYVARCTSSLNRSLRWWHFACYAAFFSLGALSQVGIGRWSFAALFGGFAVFELALMVSILLRRDKPRRSVTNVT